MRDHGDLLHMLCKCPKLIYYQDAIVSTLNVVFQMYRSRDPFTCVLGYIENSWGSTAYAVETSNTGALPGCNCLHLNTVFQIYKLREPLTSVLGCREHLPYETHVQFRQ